MSLFLITQFKLDSAVSCPFYSSFFFFPFCFLCDNCSAFSFTLFFIKQLQLVCKLQPGIHVTLNLFAFIEVFFS